MRPSCSVLNYQCESVLKSGVAGAHWPLDKSQINSMHRLLVMHKHEETIRGEVS